MKTTLIALVSAAVSLGTPALVKAKEARQATGHVAANGVSYYYEIHGKGEPLLLLHGGLGSIDMFDPVVLPALAEGRQVIAVDLHGHGRTALEAAGFSEAARSDGRLDAQVV